MSLINRHQLFSIFLYFFHFFNIFRVISVCTTVRLNRSAPMHSNAIICLGIQARMADKVNESNHNGIHSDKQPEPAPKPHIWTKYLTALRPWSFTASLTPVLLGTCLAYKATGPISIPVVVVTCITALAVHAAGNLVNTYYDFKRGVDNKKSDDKTLVEGQMNANEVATLGAVCYAIGCIGLAMLCYLSPAKEQLLALVYFGGLSGSFLYTGGLGLKYIALGDIVIFLTFGPLLVLFSFLACTGQLLLSIIPYAIPLAMNIECILHANNCRDRVSDQEAGIVTLAILAGETLSYLLFCILLFGPFIAFVYVTVHFSVWFVLPASAILCTFSIERQYRAGDMAKLPHQVASLNLILGLLFVTAVFLSPTSKLPFI